MLTPYSNHNRFIEGLDLFQKLDPHLSALAKLKYQHSADWWKDLSLETPGIYILTGGRQIGKSTSCKLLIKNVLEKNSVDPQNILLLPCDEIFDAKELGRILRFFLDRAGQNPYLLIIDEITFVTHWDRMIKSLADEGRFRNGICILTGSDTLILKEASMSFPGRRGNADQTDFHLYPLTFSEYVHLINPQFIEDNEKLFLHFQDYLECGGYLRAINDFAETGFVAPATFQTYEQWIRGDFLKRGKSEENLLQILRALLNVAVSHLSFSSLTQKIGLLTKDTCIDYIRLLERMDVLQILQAFDQNKIQGFPRKDRKFHFCDPFIYRTIFHWLKREEYLRSLKMENSTLVEASVANHCKRFGKTFYLKGQGEVDLVFMHKGKIFPIEVKWSKQVRLNDLKMLKQYGNSIILGKSPQEATIDDIPSIPVYKFLYLLGD